MAARPDLAVGEVVERAEGDDVGVLHLSESGLDLGLGAVGADDLDTRPLVPVGEQDPLTEQAVLEFASGLLIGAPGQGELGRALAE